MQSRAAKAAVAIGVVAAAVVLFVVLSSGDDDGTTTPQTGQTTQTEQQSGSTSKSGSNTKSGSNGKSGSTNEDGSTNENGSTTGTQPPTQTVTVRDGKPVGGVKKLEYRKDQRVVLVVRSDVSDEIHVHGYDLKKDVGAGGSVRFDFLATIEGVFEIELEDRREQIAELVVKPS